MSGGAPGAAADGWYPQEAYYAPGWQAPAGPPPPRRRWGLWAAGAAIALVVLAVVGLLAAQLLRSLGSRTLGEVDGPTQANARQLAPGHCVEQLPADGVVDRVTVVPCGEPHEAEVIASLELDDGEWPGAREVRRTVERACEMDAAQLEAGHRPVVWTPGEESWGQGDRTGLCLAWAPDGAVVGSWSDGTPVTPAP